MTSSTPITDPFILSLGHKFLLTEPEELIAEAIQFYTLAPMTFNPHYTLDAISLSDTLSRWNGQDINVLCEAVSRDVTNELTRLFPRAKHISASVTYQQVDSIYYSLTISPTVFVYGKSYGLPKTIMAKEGTLVLLNDNVDVMSWLATQQFGEQE